MIVRKIRPEELKRTNELFSIAFEFPYDSGKSPMGVYEEIRTNPQSREDANWNERWAAFEDDDRTMMSYFIAQPFPVQFDGHTFTMAGIGGVATLPQYRRSGGIRGCFEAALPDMYRRGMAFSYLYPFSTAYYRKFGYEMGCEKISYHVELRSLKRYDADGSCTLIEPGNFMQEEIRQIYRAWQNQYNMMIANEDWEYGWIEKSNPCKDQVFTYVYRAANGTPKGYVTFKQAMEDDGRNLLCTRFCATDAEGIKGLLNLLISLGSDHDHVTFELPVDIDMSLILPEWSGAASRKLYYAGMVRVIHAENVLLAARYRGTGSLCIALTDGQIPENNGRFLVEFADGKAVSVQRETPDAATSSGVKTVDIAMDINAFSRLIIGTCDTNSLQYMDHVTVHGDLEKIGQVFYKKPNMIAEYF